MASNTNVKYKCPFCTDRMTRAELVAHVQDEHEDELPKDFTAFRYVFNYVNRKPLTYHGKCTECGGPTPWDEVKGRYNRQCGKKACHDSFVAKFEENMLRTTGHTRMSDTAEGQVKMLANRKISGEYKFKDGGVKTYTGSYELKALEFMDKVMDIQSDDILSPGPILNYKLKDGREFMYITDFYYQPYNLVIEVKDGGNNPNRRNMPEYREKQIAKEQYIIKHTDFNYLRLTDNNLGQLIRVFADLKMQMVDNGGTKRVIHVNENTEVVKESWIKNEKDILYNKEAFDNGDINLCFITGHCGSGKSTLAHSKESDKVEVYELDDLQWSFKYSDDNFKEYGDLIYSFFKGVGKRYRIPYQIEKDGKLCELTIDDVDQWFVDNGFKDEIGDDYYNGYYEGATNAFVDYAIKYASSHKDKKYILEGIQLFLFVNPAKLKDYAVYIKGTSVLISTIRGTKRDSMGKDLKSIADNIDTFIRRIVASIGKTGFEAKINSYRKYFKDKPETVSESYLEEAYDPDINYVDYVWNIAHTEQNAVVRLKSDKVNKYRGRSELIIIKGDEVLLNKNTKNKPDGAKFNYTLPGGGWNPGEDRSFSAQREAMEEVKIVTDDVKYVTTYTKVFPKEQIPTWVKLYFKKEDRWNGTYTEVYVGKYAGKYNGAINRIDKDPKMLNNSKFYKISEIYDGLAEAHKKAIDMYLSGAVTESSFQNYKLLDIKSNKSKVLDYLKNNSETSKYANDIIDNYAGEIAVYNDTMIGRIFVGDKKDKGFITDFSIDEDHRGNKLGSRMIDDAINKYHGYDLLVDKTNKLAIDMYKRRGFVIDRTEGNQYYMKLSSAVSESYLEERSLPKGDITLYHGSCNSNIEKMLNNSPNAGKKWEKVRMSSFWFIKKEYAIMFATAELLQAEAKNSIGKDKIFILIDDDMKTLVNEKYRSTAESIMKTKSTYVYSKTVDGKYVSGGQGRNFPEYTLDFTVTPDDVYTCTYDDMRKSVKYVSENYINKVIEKYKNDKMTYGNSKIGQFIDSIIYGTMEDLIDAKHVIKGYNESYLEESTLSSYDKKPITEELVKSDSHFKHLRTDNCKGYAYYDNDKLVAFINTEDKDGEIWIQALEVMPEYRKSGFGKKLLDIAVKQLKANYLSVNKKNTIAINMYKKYGFKTYKETDTMYFMSYKSAVSEASVYNGKKLYHVSQVNLDGKTLMPKVPDNYMTKNGYEDGNTPRVCFSTSIDGCLMALSMKCNDMELYVHIPDDASKYEVLSPNHSEVPDSNITKEKWICDPVKVKCIGKIRVTGDAGEDGIPYNYGDKTAELYKWNYEWIENAVTESISADDTYHPVYIIAASYKSPLEKPIELVTGSKFAHACIALDSSFKRMYSFNGDHNKTLAHKFLGGFSAESIDLYKSNDPEALFRVHVVFLKDNDYYTLEKKIKDYEFNKTHTQYNFLGLLDVPLGKKVTSDDEKMFCSQFVDYMFKFIDVDLTNKSSNLVTPADISRIRNKRVYKIFDGIVRNFNPKSIASKIKGLLGKAEYIKESTGEFEYVDLVEEEMRESVNHIVDEMMTAATYAPVVGLRDCDAYIVNYDQNRIFDKDSEFAIMDGSEKTLIRVDKDTKKLTKESFNPSYVQPRYAYRIGTLEEVSKVLAPYIDKEVSKDFIYETFFHKKLYTHDQLKAEAAYNDNIEVHMFKEEILAPYGTFVKTCDKHLDAILKEASEIGQIDSLIEEVCNG